ncbi:helix-turn-helix domain-containing protein [Undibacterium sp.]|uniref:helix-turn-helix domain-containing protein n=1 Tax=Undibacterium sp. TaxID=1914977 RepID=UPI002731F83B|nr:helix-turn-helix transcriptional regulator [Undibacterium sp.]MDP1978334.1 helix-turn-helix transcriptional regulator [Undibacterium sp.]
MDFSLLLPDEICLTLGERTRERRLLLNISIEELAQRTGISAQTVSSFERTGKCTLANFVRILESLNATPDLQTVLVPQTNTIEDMRAKSAVQARQRAYRKTKSPS